MMSDAKYEGSGPRGPAIVKKSHDGSLSTITGRYSDVGAKATALIQSMKAIWSSNMRPHILDSHTAQARVRTLSVLSKDQSELSSLKAGFLEVFKQLEYELKVQCSALAGIHTLPKHILLRIFQLAVLSSDRKVTNVILHISRTCAPWRKLTMESPRLWCKLELLTLNIAEATVYMRNSEPLPVSIHITKASTPAHTIPWNPSNAYPHPSPVKTRLPFCQDILQRIGVFHLDYFSTDTLPPWFATSEALQLSALRLTCSASGNPTDVLESLFDGGKPKLDNIVLNKVFIPWTTVTQISHLTKLHMRFSDRPDADAYADQDSSILEIFSACNQLQDVLIECHDPLRGLPSVDTLEAPVHLRQLQKIHLDLTTLDLATILHSIATPKQLSKLRIVGRLDRRSEKASGAIQLPGDPQCLPCLTLTSNLELNMAEHRIRGDLPPAERDNRPDKLSQFCIEVAPISNKIVTDQAFIATLGLLQRFCIMPHLKELSITEGSPFHLNVDDLVLFLRHSLLLRSLTLRKCSAKLLDKLVTHWAYAAIPLCPELAHVKLIRMDVRISTLERFCGAYFGPDFELATQKKRVTRGRRDSKKNLPVRLSHEEGGRTRELLLDGVCAFSSEDGDRITILDTRDVDVDKEAGGSEHVSFVDDS